jgi:hypothetical protein
MPDMRKEQERKAKEASKMKMGSKIHMPSDAAKRLMQTGSNTTSGA